jgi:hypothetical protein
MGSLTQGETQSTTPSSNVRVHRSAKYGEEKNASTRTGRDTTQKGEQPHHLLATIFLQTWTADSFFLSRGEYSWEELHPGLYHYFLMIYDLG